MYKYNCKITLFQTVGYGNGIHVSSMACFATVGNKKFSKTYNHLRYLHFSAFLAIILMKYVGFVVSIGSKISLINKN